MSKYHLKDNGEPGKCDAGPGRCPKKNDDGLPQEHFDTYEDAQKSYENSMKNKDTSSLSKNSPKRKLNELNKLAKDTNDPEILDQAITQGSKRTYGNLLKNPNVTQEQFMNLKEKLYDPEQVQQAMRHKHFPVREMTDNEFSTIAHESVQSNDIQATQRLFSSDDITDEKINAFIEKSPHSIYKIREAVENPNNEITTGKVRELGNHDPILYDSALQSGRISPSDTASMDKKAIYWANVDREKNPNNLEGYAQWVESHRDVHRDHSHDIGRHIATNPNASSRALDTLANSEVAVKEIWKHPNTSAKTKYILEKKHPEIQRAAKIQELDEKIGGVRKAITLNHEERTPYGRNRGYHEDHVQLDKDKIKELGLSREEVLDVMESRNYMGASYDDKTGRFMGMTDSGD